jgi:hypothetical protein
MDPAASVDPQSPAPAHPLRAITPVEFARRLRGLSEQPDNRYAFFLGAGCSIASGIPSAAELVRDHWLPQLRDLRAPDRTDLDAWIKEQFPAYDPAHPALHYGQVVERLFLHPEEVQREIERLCANPFPSFGYVALAALMAEAGRSHGLFNVVLTTNFDDLVQDALFLFTRTRALVVGHEAMAHFIRPTRTRPLVVKLHGDQRLSPRNSDSETKALEADIEQQVRTLLHDRGLIFLGYGGHDKSVQAMLERLPAEALPLGVYWASDEPPPEQMIDWLTRRQAIWIKGGGDFDTTLLLLADAFELDLPTRSHFDDMYRRYREGFDKLARCIESKPAAQPALRDALSRARRFFTPAPGTHG